MNNSLISRIEMKTLYLMCYTNEIKLGRVKLRILPGTVALLCFLQ